MIDNDQIAYLHYGTLARPLGVLFKPNVSCGIITDMEGTDRSGASVLLGGRPANETCENAYLKL